MTTYYIIDGRIVHSEEYKNISQIHKTAHELLNNHNATTLDAITDNDRFTINKPGTNGK